VSSAPDHAIGLDIGGTEIGIALVRADGSILARTAIPTESDRGLPHSLVRIVAIVREMCDGNDGALVGIGIGCAGPVSPERGTVDNLFSLAAWKGCDIVTPLREALGVPVRLENDADVAAYGEWHAVAGAGAGLGAGLGAGRRRLLMLTLGTGIGGGVVIDGEIYRGAGGEHPEIGHVPVDAAGPPCFCGIRGCLEVLASGTAIGKLGAAQGIGDSRAVFAAAARGEAGARRIVDGATSAMAVAAWTLSHTFMAERIVLSGGIAEVHFALFADAMRRHLALATLIPRDEIAIVEAGLGNDAGVVGGAMLMLGEGG
jgi:glucokinase